VASIELEKRKQAKDAFGVLLIFFEGYFFVLPSVMP